MMRINHDNRLLLERINKVRPLYSKKQWEKERKQNEHIIKNLSKFYPDELFKRQPSKANTNTAGVKSSKSIKSNAPVRPATTTSQVMKKRGHGGRSGRNIRNFGKKPPPSHGSTITSPNSTKKEKASQSTSPNSTKKTSEKTKTSNAASDGVPVQVKTVVADGSARDGVKKKKVARAPLSPQEKIVRDIFHAINPNHDGTISKRKFVKAVQLNTNVQNLLGSNERLKPLLNVKQLQATFKKIDENDDGQISTLELLNFAQAIVGAHVPV